MRHPTIATRLSGRRRAVVALAAAVTLLASTAPAALADRTAADKSGKTAYPTQKQVDQAKNAVASKSESVASLKAQLVLANRRLDETAMAAEQAAEAFNGARWRLKEAGLKVTKAHKEAAAARKNVEGQRAGIAALVTQSYISGGDLRVVDALVNADGPEGVMDRYLAYEGASTSMDAAYQRFEASSALAKRFEKQAETARAAQQQAVGEARAARDQAAAAAQNAQQLSDEVAARKRDLVRQLATAQGISVKLAQERQDALARIAAEKAAAAAARRAERERQRQEAAAASAAAAAAAKQGQGADTGGEPAPPAASSTAPHPPNAGAAKAISFAKAQLGEPYRWGAAGPNSWDCSGLMMRAWGAAGVSLPHYSAAQYSAGTPISVGDLRPGDLVFWGSSSRPSSIHHVAMYIGDGRIIHAPRTGRPVSIDSLYYWIPPNFFARV